jgi:hypothetical protein
VLLIKAVRERTAAGSDSTWSFISAIRGEMTTVVPSSSIAGSWKVSDLPEPVGMIASVSRFARAWAITAA